MADDNILRSYRSNDLARRVSAPAASRDAPRDAQRDAPRDAGGNDPLAELARLIGQSDPFADFDRNGGQYSYINGGLSVYVRSSNFNGYGWNLHF